MPDLLASVKETIGFSGTIEAKMTFKKIFDEYCLTKLRQEYDRLLLRGGRGFRTILTAHPSIATDR